MKGECTVFFINADVVNSFRSMIVLSASSAIFLLVMFTCYPFEQLKQLIDVKAVSIECMNTYHFAAVSVSLFVLHLLASFTLLS